jgi:hypothetical protein
MRAATPSARSVQSESVLDGKSRAIWPGSSRIRLAALAGALVLAAAIAVTVILLSGGGSSPSVPKYGSIPDWLPKASAPANSTIQASAAHPALAAVEGNTVSVALAHGRVLATVVGPSVPAAIAQQVEDDDDATTETAPCTFTITLASASGTVPINPTTFSLLDEQGQLHPFRMSVQGGGAVPKFVGPGQKVELILKTTLPEGEGALRWAPDGRNVVAGWIYGLELV